MRFHTQSLDPEQGDGLNHPKMSMTFWKLYVVMIRVSCVFVSGELGFGIGIVFGGVVKSIRWATQRKKGVNDE